MIDRLRRYLLMIWEILARRLPRWLDSPGLSLAVTAGAYGAVAVVALSANGWDASAFATASCAWWNPATAPWSLETITSGYDGQWYYGLALNPLGDPTIVDFDAGAYRSGRIALPFFAWLLSGGLPERAAFAMILANYVALCNLGWTGGAFARALGRHAAWGLVLPCTTGLLLAFRADVTEVLATSLLVSALLFLRRRQLALATLAACCAALARETTLLASITAAGAYAWARLVPPHAPAFARGPSRWSRLAGSVLSRLAKLRPSKFAVTWHFVLLPFLTYGAWQLIVRHRWGEFSASQASQTMAKLPFAGPWQHLFGHGLHFDTTTLQRLFFFLFVVVLLCLLWRSRATLYEKMLAVVVSAFVSQLGAEFWESLDGFGRSLSEFYAVGLIVLIGARSAVRVPILLLTGVLWLQALAYGDLVSDVRMRRFWPEPPPATAPVDGLAVMVLAKHPVAGGVIIDVGHDSSWMHLRDGWYTDGWTDGLPETSVAWLLGESSSFQVSLERREEHEILLVAGAHSPWVVGKPLTCVVNGVPLAAVDLAPGVRVYRFAVPAPAVEWENRVTCRLSDAFPWVQPSPGLPLRPVSVHAIVVKPRDRPLGRLEDLESDPLAWALLHGKEPGTGPRLRPPSRAPVVINLGEASRRTGDLRDGWGASGHDRSGWYGETSWREIRGPSAAVEVALPMGRDYQLQVVAQPGSPGRRRSLHVSLNGRRRGRQTLTDQPRAYSFDLPAAAVFAQNEIRLWIEDEPALPRAAGPEPAARPGGAGPAAEAPAMGRTAAARIHALSIHPHGAQVTWPAANLTDPLARDLLRASLPAVRLFLDLGAPAAQGRLGAGWGWPREGPYADRRTSWSWMTDTTASLAIELEPGRPHELGVVMEPFWGLDNFVVEVRVNGEAVARERLWQRQIRPIRGLVPGRLIGERNHVVIELSSVEPPPDEGSGRYDILARVFAVAFWRLP